VNAPSRERFFDWLDEKPQRRGGGFIVAVKDSKAAERRSRPMAAWSVEHERRRRRLEILSRQLELEEQA
jgi:hypothetical protein